MKCYKCKKKLTREEIGIRKFLAKNRDIPYKTIDGVQYTGYYGGMPFCFNCAKISDQTHTQRMGDCN